MESDSSLYICTEIVGNELIAYSFRYQEDCHLSFYEKFEVARHVLVNGVIQKDSDGLFCTPHTNFYPTDSVFNNIHNVPISITFKTSNSHTEDRVWEELAALLNPKCVCGATSTGSNKHSSWCDIKGGP